MSTVMPLARSRLVAFAGFAVSPFWPIGADGLPILAG